MLQYKQLYFSQISLHPQECLWNCPIGVQGPTFQRLLSSLLPVTASTFPAGGKKIFKKVARLENNFPHFDFVSSEMRQEVD